MSDNGEEKLAYRSWNPIRGCTRISAGCQNCYAERFAFRLAGPGQPYEDLAMMTKDGPRWTGKIRLVPELLEVPMHWRRSSMVFVNSMSDVFHEDVPYEFINDIFRSMEQSYWHTFFIITKRPNIMNSWYEQWYLQQKKELPKNVWLGVSVENQLAADNRIPFLLKVPAAIRFLNCEPLLGPIDLSHYIDQKSCRIDWITVGAESGYRARPMNENWVRAIRDQCISAGIRFSFRRKPVDGQPVIDLSLDGVVWSQRPDCVIVPPPKKANRSRRGPLQSYQLEFDFSDKQN